MLWPVPLNYENTCFITRNNCLIWPLDCNKILSHVPSYVCPRCQTPHKLQFKEQSLIPRVFLSQTKTVPKGFSTRVKVLVWATKPEGKVIVPIITQGCFVRGVFVSEANSHVLLRGHMTCSVLLAQTMFMCKLRSGGKQTAPGVL